jgi:hypothetical protein
MSIECSNNGRFSISPSDFIEPLTISGSGKILSVVVSKANPEGLKPQIRFTDSQITIEPLLLNGGDAFSLNLLTDGEFANPNLSARIMGVKEIKRITKISDRNLWRRMIILGVFGFLIGLFGIDIVRFFASLF